MKELTIFGHIIILIKIKSRFNEIFFKNYISFVYFLYSYVVLPTCSSSAFTDALTVLNEV